MPRHEPEGEVEVMEEGDEEEGEEEEEPAGLM